MKILELKRTIFEMKIRDSQSELSVWRTVGIKILKQWAKPQCIMGQYQVV